MRLKVSGGVPEGSYLAKFVGVEPSTNSLGDCVKWTWEVTSGQYAGQTVSSLSSPRPSQRNRCGKILSGMFGKPLSTGEELDTSALVGKTFLIIVRKAENGGTFVDSVTQAPIG